MAVSKRLRYEVLKRDNHTCRYCGATAPDVVLTVDHVTPVALGGTDEPSNLVTACKDCNAGQPSTSPDAPLIDDVEQRSLQWAAAIKLAAARVAARDEPLRAYVAYMEDVVLAHMGRESVTQFHNGYACGVAWSMIREIQDEARAIVTEGD